jgi:hypothetical protein
VQTIVQIAKAYGVSDRTVRSWLKEARKVLGSDGIGRYEGGKLAFTPDEVKTLASYGRQSAPGAEPVAEVLTPELEPDSVLDVAPVQSQAGPLVMFNIKHLTVQTRQTDTTSLDTEADQLQALTQNAFGALARHLADDLTGLVRTAKAQNRHAVLGAQAAASTAAIQEL